MAVFGTNSEANSLSVGERRGLLERLVASGAQPAALMPGTGCCSITDTVELCKHAISLRCPGVLVMPPFFFPCTEEGIYTYYADLIERVANDGLRLYLYHFPKMSRAPITPSLVARLVKDFPEVIAGIKDSSGVWEDTEILIREFPSLAVFSSSEALLTRNLAAGGGGCISATANVNSRGIRNLLDSVGTATGPAAQEKANAVRAAFEQRPLIAALKAYIARLREDPAWAKTRAPLLPLPAQESASLFAELDGCGFVPHPVDF